jgi:hypothetical protein
MVLNFPESPEIGDTYVGPNGIVYTYDGEKWNGESVLPTGPTGATGPQGDTGLTGATWFSDFGEPNSNLGREGDFYLDTSNNDVYKKISSENISQWVNVTNIQGELGPTGPTGPQGISLSAVTQSIVPDEDNTHNLGSPDLQWRDIYVSTGSIYIGDVKLSNDNGQLIVQQVTDPGQETEAPVPDTPGSVTTDRLINGENSFVLQSDGTVELNGEPFTGGGGEGLPTITVPGESGTTYKGLQVSYGIVHSNSNSNELNVNKIVIHKPAVTTTTIDPTSSNDDFQVSGLGTSDVVAMFVFYGDTNGAKPVSTLQAFAEAVIDSVILDDGVEGDYNTVDAMKTAFYANYETLAAAADGLDTDFEFFDSIDTNFPVNDELTGQGSGTGFRVYGLNYNLSDDTLSLSGYDIGSGYTQGDVIVIPGTSIQDAEGNFLATPDNDITITFTEVNQFGQPMVFAFSGTLPRPEAVWPENSINDGGSDQYDTANYISTNLAEEINYNGGETVEDGTAEFGEGSVYSFVYDTAIFGLFVTGSSATLIRTSGNSGADGDSTTEAGNIYGPDTAEFTATNAVTHLNLIGDPYVGTAVTFTKTNYGDEVDEISEGLHITRGEQGWLYNPLEDEGHNDDTPTGSVWNNDGWDDFTNVESRTYSSLESIWGGNFVNIVGAKMVMLDETTGKYWAIEFLSWTNNQQGGGVSYTRQELDLDSLEEGIRFSDGTRQTTAYTPTNVKLTAPGNRRIEEVYGYKSVSVTAKETINLTTTASRNSDGQARIWVDTTTTTIDEILNDTEAAGITDTNTIEFSVDNITWYVYDGGTSFTGNERGYGVNLDGDTLTYSQGDTVYFRYVSGGVPATWWDKSELPGGGSNFRGAVIDFHAYTGESTIIGTIHIVDDDGEEHITHIEVQSGSTDGENDDLWLVTSEGRIRYRRIDGESKTLKIQWSARVFYGSETHD